MIGYICLTILVVIVAFWGVFRLGYEKGCRRATTIVRQCSAESIWKELDKKNSYIHRLENRIFKLKRANRNLRQNVIDLKTVKVEIK